MPKGLLRIMITPDQDLAKIVGDGEIPITEVNKRLWKYIKKHNLRRDLPYD